MFPPNISNSSQSFTKVFSCLEASEVINNFLQFSMTVTSGSNARLPDTAELRQKAALSSLHCLTINIIVLLLC